MEHPYLYFSRKDIPSLQKRFLKEPFLTRWKLMLMDAKEIVGKPPAGLYDNRLSYRYAATTAFVYAITGEKIYADRAIQEILTNFKLDIKERWQFDSIHCHGAGLGTSNFSLATALVYDWCYDCLTEDQRQVFRDGFTNIINPLYLQSLHHDDNREECDWWVFRYHSNWSAVCHASQGVAALAFYDEFESARKAVRYAARHIEEFFRVNIDVDGGCAEGLMYARYGIEYVLYFFVASCRMFGLDKPKRNTIKKLNEKLVGYWDMYMLAPDLAYANFGNMDEEVMRAFWTPDTRNGSEKDSKEGPNAVLCAFYDSILPDGDPLMRFGADVGGAWYIWNGACPFHLLWRKDEKDPTSVLPVQLQDAVFFRETGQAVFSSGKLWLAYNGGIVSPDSHFNRDLGSFILLSNGERFINDPGYGDSDTSSHSTLLVNGYGQIKGGYGEFITVDKGDGFYGLTCDLTHAYDPLSSLEKYIRHIIINDDSYVLIVDEVQAEHKVTFETFLQTRKPISVNNGIAEITGKRQKMYVLQATTEQCTHMDIRHFHRVERRTDTVIHTLCIEPINKASKHTFVTVLYPAQDESSLPEVHYSDGTVTISFDDGVVHNVKFKHNIRSMEIQHVNGKKLSGSMNPYERSVKPFRDITKHELDETKTPPWLFNRKEV